MLKGNAMAQAMIKAGLARPTKSRNFHHKPIKCRKCGEPMNQETADENFAYCRQCGNYIIFN